MATIDNKVTFEEFRSRCEDKSTITTKGQLYVGTFDYDTVNGKNITRTVATPVPIENALLVRDAAQAGGLNWKSVADVLLAAKEKQDTSVKNADNVTSKINEHNISDIFEDDGTTVKKSKTTNELLETGSVGSNLVSDIFETDEVMGNVTPVVKKAAVALTTSFSGAWTNVTPTSTPVSSAYYISGNQGVELCEISFFDSTISDSIATAKPYVHGFATIDFTKISDGGEYICPLGWCSFLVNSAASSVFYFAKVAGAGAGACTVAVYQNGDVRDTTGQYKQYQISDFRIRVIQ